MSNVVAKGNIIRVVITVLLSAFTKVIDKQPDDMFIYIVRCMIRVFMKIFLTTSQRRNIANGSLILSSTLCFSMMTVF